MRMRIRRYARSFSTFLGNLLGAVLKAAVVSVVVGACLVSLMHYMGVPVPSAVDLIRGVSRLANVLS
jgi:antibiotic biosynthesis monooxygenase (ABM) superfamily enzyme